MPLNKTAKPPVSRHAPPPADELRSAYEHLSRIDILEGALAGGAFVDVTALTNLARQQLGAGKPRNASDLLRAAEHMCFAALAPEQLQDALVPAALKASIEAEFENRLRRAEDQWASEDAHREVIATIYNSVLDQARRAFAGAAFWPALELARAAEALSRVGEGLPAAIPDAGLMGRLAS